MKSHCKFDWDPTSEKVMADQLAAYDEMRESCPVAYSDVFQWSVFRHADVLRILHDHETFSSDVSAHLSVPNGFDPPEHSEYRNAIEPFFCLERTLEFEPLCREISESLVGALPSNQALEFIAGFADEFALEVQCAFLCWPSELRGPLQGWVAKSQRATRAQDQQAMAEVAGEFAGYVAEALAKVDLNGDSALARLSRLKVWGRPLRSDEIVSILRNWTVGELGTIAACVGIIVHHLAKDARLQEALRRDPGLIPPALEEILRLHGPLLTNRRRTTRPVILDGRELAAGERVTLMWLAANRDEAAFKEAGEFRYSRSPEKSLLYGAGIHVCPGAALARLELRVVTECILRGCRSLRLVCDTPPQRAAYPASGFSTLTVCFER